jgi:phage terminase small subunit
MTTTKKKNASKGKKTRLSPKQALFCKEYLIDLNATQAAIRAGYSAKTAQKIGSENLLKPDIQTEVDRLKAARAQKVEVNSEDVLKELVRLSKADIREVWDEQGLLKPIHTWPDHIAACVASVEVLEVYEGSGKDRKFVGYTKKVKFWEKTKALDMLGRHLKLFSQDDDRKTPAVILIDKVGAEYGIA